MAVVTVMDPIVVEGVQPEKYKIIQQALLEGSLPAP